MSTCIICGLSQCVCKLVCPKGYNLYPDHSCGSCRCAWGMLNILTDDLRCFVCGVKEFKNAECPVCIKLSSLRTTGNWTRDGQSIPLDFKGEFPVWYDLLLRKIARDFLDQECPVKSFEHIKTQFLRMKKLKLNPWGKPFEILEDKHHDMIEDKYGRMHCKFTMDPNPFNVPGKNSEVMGSYDEYCGYHYGMRYTYWIS